MLGDSPTPLRRLLPPEYENGFNKYLPLKNTHPLKNIQPWKIFTPGKYSPLKNIHPWKIFTLWKIFTPEKYSPLKNIHPWKIFIQRPLLGASLTPLRRLLPPEYENGFNTPIGADPERLYNGFRWGMWWCNIHYIYIIIKKISNKINDKHRKPNPRLVSSSLLSSITVSPDPRLSHMVDITFTTYHNISHIWDMVNIFGISHFHLIIHHGMIMIMHHVNCRLCNGVSGWTMTSTTLWRRWE